MLLVLGLFWFTLLDILSWPEYPDDPNIVYTRTYDDASFLDVNYLTKTKVKSLDTYLTSPRYYKWREVYLTHSAKEKRGLVKSFSHRDPYWWNPKWSDEVRFYRSDFGGAGTEIMVDPKTNTIFIETRN
ncbi:hypothetical protein ACFL1G_02970 [Planctomycetota bacterium]